MKSPDGSTAAHPTATQAPPSVPTQIASSAPVDISKTFKLPETPVFDGTRRRASSLDVNDFTSRPLQRTASSGWLQSFTRRASIDFTDVPLSPAGSVENLANPEGSQFRSRNNSGDVIPTIAEHGGGLVGAQPPPIDRMERRKSEPVHAWKWKLFSVPQNDDLRRRKINETEEGIQSLSANKNTTSPPDVTTPSFSILGYARKMSARDLNALSPSGDL